MPGAISVPSMSETYMVMVLVPMRLLSGRAPGHGPRVCGDELADSVTIGLSLCNGSGGLLCAILEPAHQPAATFWQVSDAAVRFCRQGAGRRGLGRPPQEPFARAQTRA